ncbi:M949_RS01915 family surface polysaccharide biosynthesis protein [uncultured Aquimarina sp.]|uniref:M949_RS01915 family surface polysaccharide biosynthesis protein n=1 Tax=uncultured Aquimarina sp. TaxID=575652 RepID=UPI00262826C5|nr:hypothetical protein [uncultured Aquimarina sp.]
MGSHLDKYFKISIIFLGAMFVNCKDSTKDLSKTTSKINPQIQDTLCPKKHEVCVAFNDNEGNKLFTLFEKKTTSEIFDEIEEEISNIENTELFVKLYKNDQLTVKVYDKIDCYTDGYVNYIKDSFSITDLDKDGIKETSFLYILNCDAEPMPSKMKLIMIEGEQKYKIRGEQSFLNSSEIPKFSIDNSFKKAPVAFLDFSVKLWNQNIFDPTMKSSSTEQERQTQLEMIIQKNIETKNSFIE